jgi:hypothetical protein
MQELGGGVFIVQLREGWDVKRLSAEIAE